MAIIKSAKKAHRQAIRRRVFNVRRSRAMRSAVSDLKKMLVAGKGDEAVAHTPKLQKAIDKAVKRGIIKPNTGARMKSRLTKSIAKSTASN